MLRNIRRPLIFCTTLLFFVSLAYSLPSAQAALSHTLTSQNTPSHSLVKKRIAESNVGSLRQTRGTAGVCLSPPLGNYTTTTITIGGHTSITPDAAPSGATSLTAIAPAGFTGTLTVNSTTGAVNVSNAGPVGSYVVKVYARNGCISPTTRTFTLTVGAAAICSGVNFSGPTLYATGGTGSYPNAIAVGDFNGDGQPDLATANSAYSVGIFLNNGAGSFSTANGSPITLFQGGQATAIVTGDFNGDGNLDLAAGDDLGKIFILLGDGNGGFTVTGSPLNAASLIRSIAIGDFNGDGKLDLAATNYTTNNLTILLGDGSGGFSAATGSPIAVGSHPYSVVVGDFNRDNKTDLAVANLGSNSVSILLGDGSGSFSAAAGSPVALSSNPYSLAIGDFNGDSYQDLAVASYTGSSVTILLGDGNGGLTATANTLSTGTSKPNSIALGDFDGDGKQDLVTASTWDGKSYFFLGQGDGSFTQAAGSPVSTGSGMNQVFSADLNGDGKQDLAFAGLGAGKLIVQISTCRATSTTTLISSSSTSSFGQSVTFTATVSGVAGTATGTVTFKDGSTTLGTGTLDSNGQATLMTSALSVGSHSVTAEYGGDSTYNVSTSSALTQTVSKMSTSTVLASSLNPAVYGQSITLTATVSSANLPSHVFTRNISAPSGTVSFYKDGTLFGTATLNAGTATLTTSVLTPGSYSFTATYAGDSMFVTSTSNALTQVVNQSVSTVALSSAVNPVAFKQFVTLTATVNVEVRGALAPTGIIIFRDGTDVLGTISINSADQAVLRTTNLTIGSHTITAEYSGDSNYQGQTSADLTQSVEKGITTTTLSSSANPSSFGQSIALTATVIARNGTPTGSVEFYDGGQLLGSASLNGSTATLTTDVIGSGVRTLTAGYTGDEQFSASTSSPLTQTMNLVCTYTLSNLSQTYNLAGGNGQIKVMGRLGCGWLAGSNVPWVTIVGGDELGINGNGDGTVNLVVAPLTDGVSRTGTLTIAGQTVTITQAKPVAVVSGASFTGEEVAPGEIVSVFGADLSVGTDGAAELPLPTTLAGTQVKITDSQGVARLAPLFYVSPLQINYQVPEDTALGSATITIINGSEEVTGAGTINIAAVAPGLFAVNSNGQGVAVALAQRVTADGTVTYEVIWQIDEVQGKFVPAPIDLGPDTDQVFLALFGTGFRHRTSLATVTAFIGDQEVEVLYVGAQGEFTGLDQINLRLPRTLNGMGETDLTLRVDGKVVNTLRINIK